MDKETMLYWHECGQELAKIALLFRISTPKHIECALNDRIFVDAVLERPVVEQIFFLKMCLALDPFIMSSQGYRYIVCGKAVHDIMVPKGRFDEWRKENPAYDLAVKLYYPTPEPIPPKKPEVYAVPVTMMIRAFTPHAAKVKAEGIMRHASEHIAMHEPKLYEDWDSAHVSEAARP